MQTVNRSRLVGMGLAALLTVAATFPTTALFSAPSPGSNLQPVGGAEKIIDLVQGQETILWSSIGGVVMSFKVVGWPSNDGTHEVGGALVIERPVSGQAGVIDFGEKPMTVEFDVTD